MTDPHRDQDIGEGPDLTSATGTPLWVKVFGVIALMVVVLVVIVMLVGGGEHGPGRHTGGGPLSTETTEVHAGPPPGVVHDQQP